MSSQIRTFQRRPPISRPQDRTAERREPRLPPRLAWRPAWSGLWDRTRATQVALLAAAAAVGLSLVVSGGAATYAGLLGTWPLSRQRVDAEVALMGVHPPAFLAPPGADPDRWLLEGDPHLASLVLGRLEDEAALRLVATGLGARPDARAVERAEAVLRATPAWSQMGRAEGWSDLAWRALARRCAWEQAALGAMPPPPRPSAAQLRALYHREYRHAPPGLPFQLVEPALAAQLDRRDRFAELAVRVRRIRRHLKRILWDRALEGGAR